MPTKNTIKVYNYMLGEVEFRVSNPANPQPQKLLSPEDLNLQALNQIDDKSCTRPTPEPQTLNPKP